MDAAVGPIKRMNAVNNGPRINNAEQVYTGTTGYVLDDNITSARDVTVRLDGGRFDAFPFPAAPFLRLH